MGAWFVYRLSEFGTFILVHEPDVDNHYGV